MNVRLLVAFSRGSASNIVARMISPALSAALKQTIEIERIEGENGALCMEALTRAPADGSTLAIAISANIVGTLMHAPKRYDPLVDFAPIALIAKSPMVLAVSNTLNVSSVAELIALTQTRPGELAYAASAIGGAPHLAGVMFNAMAGTQLRLRVYKETEVLYSDLEQGKVALTFNYVMSALPLAQAGKLHLLAVTSPERSAQAPEVPTLAEAGLAGYQIVNFVGVVAPAGTPAAIVTRINSAIGKALDAPELRQAFLARGMEPAAGSPEAFADHMRTELGRWGRFIQAHRAAFAEPG